jgi:hypothetical protein
MDEGWNFVVPLKANQSVAVEALALSLASSFEVAGTGPDGAPIQLRTRGSDPSSRPLSLVAAEAEFTRCWAVAVSAGDEEFAELLELEVQNELILAVEAYMEVNDLGYMSPIHLEDGADQLKLEFSCGSIRTVVPAKNRMW